MPERHCFAAIIFSEIPTINAGNFFIIECNDAIVWHRTFDFMKCLHQGCIQINKTHWNFDLNFKTLRRTPYVCVCYHLIPNLFAEAFAYNCWGKLLLMIFFRWNNRSNNRWKVWTMLSVWIISYITYHTTLVVIALDSWNRV